jgi:antitoxin (DNA-binding transcriptional repressor) of toxin-antitoxin stability system
MKQVGIRELNGNISKYIKEAPIQITNRNMIVATLLPGDVEVPKEKKK